MKSPWEVRQLFTPPAHITFSAIDNPRGFNPGTPDFNYLRCDLCTSWELAADGLTYTFHINPDANWWDGVPVTAHEFFSNSNAVPGCPCLV